MGIVPKFGNGYVFNEVMLFQKRLEQATIFTLKYLGESLAKYTKDNYNYTDQTGNLTNSIAYAVVKDKDIVYYDATNQPGEGAEEALKLAMKIASSLPNTFSLIIVAGMNYAAYVEAKGYNVILPAELKAKTDFPIAIKELIAKAKQKAKEKFGNVA